MQNKIVAFISRYIPREIEVNGQEYTFQIFINHAHYDIRLCYSNEDADPSFVFLIENIGTDADLLEALADVHASLHRRGLLSGEYATAEGYTYKKHLEFLKSNGG